MLSFGVQRRGFSTHPGYVVSFYNLKQISDQRLDLGRISGFSDIGVHGNLRSARKGLASSLKNIEILGNRGF